MKLLLFLLLLFSTPVFCQDKFFRIEGTVFDLDVYVIVTKDTAKAYKTAISIVGEENVSHRDFVSRGLTLGNVDEGTPVILWIPKVPSNTEEYAILSHEIFHTISMVLRWAGVSLSEDTDEVYAYMVQYYTLSIFNEMFKKDGK